MTEGEKICNAPTLLTCNRNMAAISHKTCAASRSVNRFVHSVSEPDGKDSGSDVVGSPCPHSHSRRLQSPPSKEIVSKITFIEQTKLSRLINKGKKLSRVMNNVMDLRTNFKASDIGTPGYENAVSPCDTDRKMITGFPVNRNDRAIRRLSNRTSYSSSIFSFSDSESVCVNERKLSVLSIADLQDVLLDLNYSEDDTHTLNS